jgi:hypothetical protein
MMLDDAIGSAYTKRSLTKYVGHFKNQDFFLLKNTPEWLLLNRFGNTEPFLIGIVLY